MGQQPLQGPPFKSKGPGPQLRAPGPPPGPPVMLQHTGPALIPQAGSTDRLNPAPSFGTPFFSQSVTMLGAGDVYDESIMHCGCACRLSTCDLKQVLYLSTKTAGGFIPTAQHEHDNQTTEALPKSREVITSAAGCLP